MMGIDLTGHAHIIMGIIWLLIIGLGILSLATLFPKTKRAGKLTNLPDDQKGDSAGSALEIVNRRYARGELTKEQYEGMRHDLER